ncbi:hypothetical protein [Gorillibacterium sp. sgz5001074]|uniref:hypothetical protein n=1 Tax=Gorillibacterium sp. sgz5001074 TaxID=3446695 RepID=UPI003F66CDA6
MSDSFTFLEPWKREESEIYKHELLKELSGSHILKDKEVFIVARRIDRDDVLFKLQTNPVKYAQVHLTWKGKIEEDNKWPRTNIYDSFEEWVNTIMLIDNLEYENQ